MELAIVGIGKLGLALLKGITTQEVLPPQDIGLLDPHTERANELAQQYGVRTIEPTELKEFRRTLICIQPRVFPDAAQWLAQKNVGYISTMAGVDTHTLMRRLGKRVIRVMPNLGATIGHAQTAMTGTPEAVEAGDLDFAQRVFSAVGDVYDLPEHLFNVFTGMSASGPAYLAVIAEALADGGVRMGLPRELANELAAKVLISSGHLLQEQDHPGLLKDQITSPGGTTLAGLEVIESAGVRGAMMKAVITATKRGNELGKDQDAW